MKKLFSFFVLTIVVKISFCQINFSDNLKVDYKSRKNYRYQDCKINQITNTNGKVYVLGIFDSINSIYAKNIAVFDGLNWSRIDVGKEFTEGFYLTTFRNQIYISGQWGSTSGVKRLSSNGQWEFFGTGLTPGYSNNPILIGKDDNLQLKIYSMVNYKGDLICGGELGPIGTLNSNLIKWNGSSWSELAHKNSYWSGKIKCMAEYNNILYIGGNFNNDSLALLKWDGNQLIPIISHKTINDVTKMISFNNQLYIGTKGGNGGLYIWNGFDFKKLVNYDIYDMKIVEDHLLFAYNTDDYVGIVDNSDKVTYQKCYKENNQAGLDYFRGSIITSYCSGCRAGR
jgi:hypothetical protein